MTYLEFVLTRLQGPPSGNSWPCHNCGRRRLSLHWCSDGKQRWGCNSTKCPGDSKGRTWGDDCDLFRDVLHITNWSDRLDKRAAMRAEWEALRSPPLPRREILGDTQHEVDPADVELAYADLLAALIELGVSEQNGFSLLAACSLLCKRRKVTVESLLEHRLNTEWVKQDALFAHVVACSNPSCPVEGCVALQVPGLQPDWGALAGGPNEGERRNGDGN